MRIPEAGIATIHTRFPSIGVSTVNYGLGCTGQTEAPPTFMHTLETHGHKYPVLAEKVLIFRR